MLFLFLFLSAICCHGFCPSSSAARCTHPRQILQRPDQQQRQARPLIVLASSAAAEVASAGGGGAAMEDILGDGGLLKKCVRPPKPGKTGLITPLSKGSVVVVRYSGAVAGGQGGGGGPGRRASPVFATSESTVMTVGDEDFVPGWNAALMTMAVGEVAEFKVGARYAYGAKGVAPVIPPGADLMFSVEILDLKGNMLTDNSFSDSAPLTPRTPATIKADYERRQASKAPDKEGLEGIIDFWKNVYVFGFFDAKPGGQLPWYLRPAITFPTMVGFVLVLAWLTGVMGGVTIQREAFGLERLVPETVAEAMK